MIVVPTGTPISQRAIGRLTLYRRVLRDLPDERSTVFSHELASMTGVSAAQLRRDLMPVGCQGTPNRGYDVRRLLGALGNFLDGAERTRCAIVGVGNLGRALLAYVAGRNPHLAVVAAFDRDHDKVGRVIQGFRCYPIEEFERYLKELQVQVVLLAVPPDVAQGLAERAMLAGICSLVNFAPTALRLPPTVYVEQVDLTLVLERAAFFAAGNPTPTMSGGLR